MKKAEKNESAFCLPSFPAIGLRIDIRAHSTVAVRTQAARPGCSGHGHAPNRRLRTSIHLDSPQRVPSILSSSLNRQAHTRLQCDRIQERDTHLIRSRGQVCWDKHRILKDCVAGEPLANVRVGADDRGMTRRAQTKRKYKGPVDWSDSFIDPPGLQVKCVSGANLGRPLASSQDEAIAHLPFEIFEFLFPFLRKGV